MLLIFQLALLAFNTHTSRFSGMRCGTESKVLFCSWAAQHEQHLV